MPEIEVAISYMNQKEHSGNASRREKAAAQRQRARIRNLMLAGGGLLILAAVLLASFKQSAAFRVSPAQVGAALGDFSLADIQSKTVHLSDYQGKTVLINAWATWCPPCKAEMPLLNQYYQAHAAQNFVLLAVNAGDSQAEAAAFANLNGLAFPVLLDPGTQLLDLMGIHSFPTSVLLGKDGIVKTIHVGMFSAESIEAEITPLLQ